MSRSAALSTGWAHRYGGWTVPRPGPFGAGRPPVTFAPGTPLLVRVYLALTGNINSAPSTWSWTDITDYVRYNPGITATTGRQDESSRVSPGRATLTLDNRDGRFSRHNPAGPYYDGLDKNVPILVTINAGNGAYNAVEMYVSAWPARWDKTGTDHTVTIECGGILRRLTQSGGISKSPMYRTLESSGPLAWWPLEAGDERSTTSVPSGLSGGKPMVAEHATAGTHVATGVVGGGTTGPAGASRAVDLSGGGQLRGTIPVSTPTNPWRIELSFLFAEPVTASETGQLFRLNFGDFNVGVFAKSTSGAETEITFTDNTTTVTATTSLVIDDGAWHHCRLDCESSGGGADTAYTLYIDGESTLTGTATNVTFANPNSVVVSRTGDLDAASHLTIWSESTLPTALAGYNAFTGHADETATARIERLCDEENIRVTIDSGDVPAATLGPQGTGNLLDVLREAETADGGVLYERNFGLGYQPLAARYNPPVLMALDFTNGDIAEEPEPADDDQKFRNTWSVTRTGGGTKMVSDTGSVGSVGSYSESLSVGVAEDSQAEDIASWLVHVGTDDDIRWPSVALNFANTAGRALIQQWTELPPLGARITVDNPPSQVTSELVDVFIEGKTEHFTTLEWTVDLNTTPVGPYIVGELDHDVYGRLSPEDSGLDTDIDSTTTSIDVTRFDPLVPLWTTDAEDFPFDINIGGERMTVTSIAGASSTQTFTVTRSVNGVVKSHEAFSEVELWHPLILVL